jgi:hypothetical protein
VNVTEIRERLDSNLDRVQSLLALFDEVESKSGPTKTDLLRAAVVFLHATLEDVIRTGLELKLPHARPEHLVMLDFAVGDTTKEKINVAQLARHRGKTIDQLLRERIDAYLERSNFNNIADVDTALERLTVERSVLDPHKDALAAMMLRRHWIVHRADRNRAMIGPGQQRTSQISANTIATWKDTVAAFCSKLLDTLERP